MAHSRQDITTTKNDYVAAADKLLALLAGSMAAIENGKRGGIAGADVLMDLVEAPLVLTEQTKRQNIKDLADKMGG